MACGMHRHAAAACVHASPVYVSLPCLLQRRPFPLTSSSMNSFCAAACSSICWTTSFQRCGARHACNVDVLWGPLPCACTRQRCPKPTANALLVGDNS